MSDPTFGISITRIDEEPRPAIASDMSIIGIVGTAPNADAATFPLNTPVLVYSDDTTKIALLGAEGATNTLRDAIEGVNDQLGEFQVAARCVVVRVEVGNDEAETLANVAGASVSGTGLHALKAAGDDLGLIPRLIIAPGYTSQFNRTGGATNVVDTPLAGNTGDGALSLGTPAYDANVEAGTYQVRFIVGETDGGIFSVTDPSGYVKYGQVGTEYSDGVIFTIADGAADFVAGDGFDLAVTITGDAEANPVVAEMAGVCSTLLAVSIVDAPATDETDATDWRETIQSERVIPVAPAVKVIDGSGNTVTRPLSPRVAGVAVRRDHEFQGRPFHSWANQPIQGIVGPSRKIPFTLTDGATEGQSMLSKNIGVLIRGQMGVEQAIASGGFVFLGTDTCSEDSLWTFYNQVRGRDYIHLLFLRTLRFYLGRFNITLHTIQAIINTMNQALRSLQADQDILGFKCGFTRDQNTPEELRLGRFTVSFAAEEAAPLRYLGIQSARYRPALDALLDQLEAQLNEVA